MGDRTVIFADPFGTKRGSVAALPAGARLACAYEVFVQFEYFVEAAFFRRTRATDELWIGEGDIAPIRVGSADGIGPSLTSFRAQFDRFIRAFVVPRAGDERAACLGLLDLLLRARSGFCAPEEFSVPGIVDAAAYDGLLARIEKEREESRQKAREAETEIIRVARELGLQPQPTGDGPSHWCATCPSRNHHLLIAADSNSFGCGYCRRKGSVEELRAFVAERRGADEAAEAR